MSFTGVKTCSFAPHSPQKFLIRAIYVTEYPVPVDVLSYYSIRCRIKRQFQIRPFLGASNTCMENVSHFYRGAVIFYIFISTFTSLLLKTHYSLQLLCVQCCSQWRDWSDCLGLGLILTIKCHHVKKGPEGQLGTLALAKEEPVYR